MKCFGMRPKTIIAEGRKAKLMFMVMQMQTGGGGKRGPSLVMKRVFVNQSITTNPFPPTAGTDACISVFDCGCSVPCLS